MSSKMVLGSNIENIYSLTPVQEGMLYHKLANGDSTAYVVQHRFELNGLINEQKVEEAIQLVTMKHDVLRTSIVFEKLTMPRQIILKNRTIEYERIDLSDIAAYDRNNEMDMIAQLDVKRGFDLQRDSLLRVKLVHFGANQYKMLWTIHHIIIDGWSLSILFSDFKTYYDMLENGKSLPSIMSIVETDKKRIEKYGDYVKWLEQQNASEGIAYWEQLLSDYDGTADIKSMEQTPLEVETVSLSEMKLSKEQTASLQNLVATHHITMNTIVETAWGIVLQAYTGAKDVVYGKVISGRHVAIRGIEKIVGPFIVTIPARIRYKEDDMVVEVLRSTQLQGTKSTAYSYCPLQQIMSLTKQKSELIKYLYAFENYELDETLLTQHSEGLGLKIEAYREQTNYDLVLIVNNEHGYLRFQMQYASNHYGSREIEAMLLRLQVVLLSFANNPEMKLSELETITEEEKEQILGVFNDTYLPYAKDKTIPALWEEQVANRPDATAVVYEDNHVTYDALNRKINQVAWALRRLHIKPDDRVVIVAERSVEMIAGMYGIIKAGGAYVPVDPTIPAERMRFILNDCKPKAVLVYKTTIETDLPTINLAADKLWEGQDENPEQVNRPDDLAYIIYTSGTTGQPKGVMLAHSGVVAMRSYLQEKYEVTQQDNVLQFANYIFDASVWEMTLSLLLGAKLTLVSQGVLSDVSSFNAFIKKNGITLTLLPPQYYLQTDISGLRVLTTGGSAANAEMIKKAGSGTRYINAYGPTESTVLATGWEYDGESDIPYPVPIGKPTSNTQIYIMDGMKLCGIGVPGELCIAGSGVAKGYLNLPALTAEKFIENPYGEGKLYRSGDLAKWLPDGNIAYLGRMDDQVKIRGFRIELGEVENALRQLEGIQDAAVLVRDTHDGEKALFAYLISKDIVQLQAVRRDLEEVLPAYMVPAYMVQIEQLPVTRNGKLDKRALPEIVAVSEKEYAAPKNELEAQLCSIFSEVLGVERVGTQDSFFELGGDSIKAIRIVSKLRSAGYHIAIKDIMQKYTVEAISYAAQKSALEEQYEQAEVSGIVPLTPIVREFASWNLPKPHHFNQDMLMEI
ncbi:non-ribosomal peptide synthetase, partial [Paenibacillus chitinolyticus]